MADASIADRMRALRDAVGLTQEALADAAEVARTSIVQIEGRHAAAIDLLINRSPTPNGGFDVPLTAICDKDAAPAQCQRRLASLITTSLRLRDISSPANTPADCVLTITYLLFAICNPLSLCAVWRSPDTV